MLFNTLTLLILLVFCCFVVMETGTNILKIRYFIHVLFVQYFTKGLSDVTLHTQICFPYNVSLTKFLQCWNISSLLFENKNKDEISHFTTLNADIYKDL